MKNLKNLLTVILSVLLMVAIVAGFSVVPATADDEIVYEFSSAKWDWWGAVQGTVNGVWGQDSQGITRHYDSGKVTYDCDPCTENGNGFQQLQDKWQKLPTGDLYFDFTNNTGVSVTVKFQTSVTLFETTVPANSTKKISFKNEKEEGFSLFAMNWSTVITAGKSLFEVGPIYKVDDGGTTVTTTTVKEDPNVLYKFNQTAYNWAKTEGWNNSTSQWGTFTGLEFNYLPTGGAQYTVTADSLSVFRQINSNWKNVPALTDDAYIDITNNANRAIRVKIVSKGYTTPADSELPQIAVGATETIKLGKLTGGAMQIMIQDFENADKLEVGEKIFTISPLYKKESSEVTTTTVPEEVTTTTVPEEVTTTTVPQVVTTTTVPEEVTTTTKVAVTDDPTVAPTTAIVPVNPGETPAPAVLMSLKAKAKLKLTAYKKALKIKVKKTVKNADGYQIKIAKNKKFKKATVKLTTKNTLKIKKLNRHTKYFVKARAFQNVNGTRVFGAWSKVYTKKTK